MCGIDAGPANALGAVVSHVARAEVILKVSRGGAVLKAYAGEVSKGDSGN